MADQPSKAVMQEMIGRSLFHQLFQPEVLDIDHDNLRLTVKMKMSDALERQPGTRQWHGGAISAVVDTVGCYGFVLLSNEPMPTINFRTDYLRPAVDTDLTVIAHVRKAGRRIAVVDVDVMDELNRLVAVGRACYAAEGSGK